MRLAILALVLALQGCGANYAVRASSSTVTATTSSSGAYVATTGGGGFLFLAVMLGVMSTEESSQQAVPQMSPTRTINEQDCTRPVSFTGNLRCR
jgi:hypothetical protein